MIKTSIVALTALFITSAAANAVTTTKCWPSTGNWENAATTTCEVYGGGSPKEPFTPREHDKCDHEKAK